MTKLKSILLIGLTGSGKTPLGEDIEKSGLFGQRCVHFDFGDELRKISNGAGSNFLTRPDITIIKNSIESNKLLENKTFYLAEKILNNFIAIRELRQSDFLILNGLPRHIGQARDVDKIVDIFLAIYLKCSTEAVRKRIFRNTGGDRDKRDDDSIEAIKEKIEIFSNRTLPLLAYYRKKLKIEILNVEADTSSEQLYEMVVSKAL